MGDPEVAAHREADRTAYTGTPDRCEHGERCVEQGLVCRVDGVAVLLRGARRRFRGVVGNDVVAGAEVVRITARVSLPCASPLTASAMPCHTARLQALRFSGRLMRRVVTPGQIASMISSGMAASVANAGASFRRRVTGRLEIPNPVDRALEIVLADTLRRGFGELVDKTDVARNLEIRHS